LAIAANSLTLIAYVLLLTTLGDFMKTLLALVVAFSFAVAVPAFANEEAPATEPKTEATTTKDAKGKKTKKDDCAKCHHTKAECTCKKGDKKS